MTKTDTQTTPADTAAPDPSADAAALYRAFCVLAQQVTRTDHPRLALAALAADPAWPGGAEDCERIARRAGVASLPVQVRLPPARVRPVALDAGEPGARSKNTAHYTAEPGKNDRMRADARQAEAEYRNHADVSLQASNRYLSEPAIAMRRRAGLEMPAPRPMFPVHEGQQVSTGTEQP